MIRFLEVSFNNYIIFNQATIPLENQGVVFVKGLNHDEGGGSNGAGKSTALEAIQAPCFAGTSRSSKNELTRGSDLEIVVKFQKGTNTYELRQYRAHQIHGNALIIIKNGHPDPDMPKGITARQAYIRDILGISFEEYSHFIHVPQKAFSTLIHGAPTERYNFISNLFQLDVYDQMWYKIDERHQLIIAELSELATLEGRLQQLQKDLQALPTHEDIACAYETSNQFTTFAHIQKDQLYGQVETLKNEQNAVEAYRRCIASYGTIQDTIASILLRLTPEFELCSVSFGDSDAIAHELMKVNRFVAAMRTSMDEATATKHVIKQREDLQTALTQVGAPDKNKADVTARIAEIQKLIAQREQQAKLRVKAKQLETELLKYAEVVDVTTELEANKSTLTSEKVTASNNVSRLQKLLRNIASLTGDAICDNCGTQLTQEHLEKHQTTYKAELESEQKKMAALASELTRLELRLLAARERDKLSNELTKLDVQPADPNEPDLHQELFGLMGDQTKLIKKEQVEGQLKQLPVINKTLQELQEQYEAAQKKHNDLQAYWRALDAAKATFATLPINYAALDETVEHGEEIQVHEKAYKELVNAITEASKDQGELLALLERIEQVQDQVKEVEQSLKGREELLKKDRIYKVLKKAYDKKGLKLDKMRKIIKAVCMVLPKYTRLLFSNTTFDANPSEDSVSFVAMKRGTNGDMITYDVDKISGGEECRLIACFVFAFHEVNNETKRSNILILDEVDHYMDDVGVAAFYSDVLPIAREKYESIFVISHASELHGRMYDRTLLVEKRNGTSTIKLL